jgi:nucleosome binding factor SPN SPT16 subunit
MSMDITMDPQLFTRHIKELLKQWESDYPNIDGFVVVNGREPTEREVEAGVIRLPNPRTRGFQSWLFCYELTDTLIAVAKDSVTVYCAQNKAKILERMQESMGTSDINLKIIRREKDKESTKKVMNEVINDLKASKEGKTLGIFKKEQGQHGDFSEIWESCLKASELELTDISKFFSDMTCNKDIVEQKCIRTSASITLTVLKKFVLPKIEDVIDSEKSMTHSEIAAIAEDLFAEPKKISDKLMPEVVDQAYTPIVQSGGRYDLGLFAVNREKNLSFDTIICSLGTKYKQYCSDVARTFFVNPSKDQEEIYGILLDIQAAVVVALRPNSTLGQVHQKGLDVLKTAGRPELVSKLTINLGFSIGIEYQDQYYQIVEGNKKKVRQGMVFNIRLGFDQLKADNKNYAILLADTVLVGEKNNEVLTDKISKELSEISYVLGSSESEEMDEDDAKKISKKDQVKKSELSLLKNSLRKKEKLDGLEVGSGPTKRVVRNTMMRDLKNNSASAEAQRSEHQQKLTEEMIELAKKALTKKKKGAKDDMEVEETKEFYSYNSQKEFPPEVQRDTIFVDTKRESIILPIHGQMVPFHIQTIRSVTKNDDHLRILFKYPGGGNSPNDKLSDFADETATFIKGLTYRITNVNNLNNAYRLIMELKKRTTQRETELKQKQSLKVQPSLLLNPGNRVYRLPNLRVRPVMGNAKLNGNLETHANGFRFNTKKGNIDIIYSNIKHAFFQPTESFSPIVCLHFHLHNDIMVGKKKTQDIQFYSELVEMSMTVSGPSKKGSRWGDQEEQEEEQRERQMKAKLGQDFKNFIKKCDEITAGKFSFEEPYTELGFMGVPTRNNILLQPTVSCLIHVIETPFFVMSLDEVQIAYFERVQFSLKNFDLVFIFKDWSMKEVHINAIPVEALESIKSWLDSCNIKYYQGKANLNWRKVLDRISLNPAKFWDEGGWEILNVKASDESDSESDQDDESDAEGAAYKPATGSESSEDSEEFNESDSDSDGSGSEFSDASESDLTSGEGGSRSESEDAGLDWDELEQKATRDDLKRSVKRPGDSDDDDDRKAKRPRTSAAPRGTSGPPRGGGAPRGGALTPRGGSNANRGGMKQSSLLSSSANNRPPMSSSLFGNRPGLSSTKK